MKLSSLFLRATIMLVLTVVLLTGCSNLFKMENWKNLLGNAEALQSISILTDQDVNGGYPLALDVVAITDLTVLNSLAGLRAAEWFSGKTDFQRQHQGKLTVFSWELVPGQIFTNIKVAQEPRNVVGIVVYADYLGERSYRASVQNQKKIVIRLQRDDFYVVSE